MLRKYPILILLCLSPIFFSCSNETVYQENIDFKTGKWPSAYAAQFPFIIQDTSKTYDLVYMLRNNLDYPYYNLYLKYSIKDTLGNKLDENLQELILSNKKTGKPFGSGFGSTYDHQFYSVKNFSFPYNGTYYFHIIHYMRKDSLDGIQSIGLKILNSEKQTESNK